MVCRACGYEDFHNKVYCTLCGALFENSATPAENPASGKHNTVTFTQPAEKVEPDLYLTLHIGEIKMLMPFPMGAELILGRGGDLSTSTIVNPVHNLYPRQGGELHILDETITFLNLTPYGADKAGVSRKHTRIRRDERALMLRDAGSTNGTRLNNEPLLPGQRRVIRNGDIITLGLFSVKVTYYIVENSLSKYQTSERDKPAS